MKELHDNSLVYGRTGESSVTIDNFTPEETNVEELAAFGVVLITDKMQDFIFDAADLSSFDDPEPQNGDTIVWNGNTFKVFIEPNAPYTYVTSTRKRIRVHAKQIA